MDWRRGSRAGDQGAGPGRNEVSPPPGLQQRPDDPNRLERDHASCIQSSREGRRNLRFTKVAMACGGEW